MSPAYELPEDVTRAIEEGATAIAALRHHHRMPPAELALRAGVPRAALDAAEAGETALPADALVRVAHALAVPVDLLQDRGAQRRGGSMPREGEEPGKSGRDNRSVGELPSPKTLRRAVNRDETAASLDGDVARPRPEEDPAEPGML